MKTKLKLKLGLNPTANTLRQNLPLEALNGNTNVLALESASFLWASGIWDSIMQNALDFQTRMESSQDQFKTGIHADAPRVWHTLPIEERKE